MLRSAYPCLALVLSVVPAAPAQCPVDRIGPPAYGNAMRFHRDTLVVSADPYGLETGGVIVYERSSGQWAARQVIVPPDAHYIDVFGNHIEIEGDRMFVGSPRAHIARPQTGGIYIYDYTDGQWEETGRIGAPPAVTTGFGAGVVGRGDFIMAAKSGIVYTYVETAEGWEPLEEVVAPEGRDPLTIFGGTLALTDEWAFVGAPRDSSFSLQNGSVYVYRRNPDNTLTFTQKLVPSSPTQPEAMHFGGRVAIDGGVLAVTAPGVTRDLPEQGVVFIYEFDGEQWTLRQEIVSSHPTRRQWFGYDLDVHGDILTCGTRREGENWAYAFRRGADGHWRQVARMTEGPMSIISGFSWALATDGRRLAVGGRDEADQSGVYVFDLDCEICQTDLDADGALTIFDFITFLNLFDAGDMQADFDGDGELTIFDFLAFGAAFDAGC